MKKRYYIVLLIAALSFAGWISYHWINGENSQSCALPSDYRELVINQSNIDLNKVSICGQGTDQNSFAFCQISQESGIRSLILKSRVNSILHLNSGERLEYKKDGPMTLRYIPWVYGAGEIKLFELMPKRVSTLILNDFDRNCSIVSEDSYHKLFKIDGDFQLCVDDKNLLGIDVNLPSIDNNNTYLLFLEKEEFTYCVFISKNGKRDFDLTPQIIFDTFG